MYTTIYLLSVAAALKLKKLAKERKKLVEEELTMKRAKEEEEGRKRRQRPVGVDHKVVVKVDNNCSRCCACVIH